MGYDESTADAWSWYRKEWESDSDEIEIDYLTRNTNEDADGYETDDWS